MRRALSIGILLIAGAGWSVAQEKPVALDDSLTISPIDTVDIAVLANDFDSDGDLDSSSIEIVSAPTIGIAQAFPGSIRYTPDLFQEGLDSLKYIVRDLAGDTSNVATVRILVNWPPSGFDAFLMTPQESTLVIVVTDYAFDSGIGILDVSTTTVTVPPTRGFYEIDPTFGEISYTPNSGERGLDSLTFIVYDNSGVPTNPINVYITINNPPIALPDSAVTGRNTPVTIDVLANDTDSDGFIIPGFVGVEITPDSGSFEVDTLTGAITYTPNPGFVGVESFEYFVMDNDGGFSGALVTVRVLDADPPFAEPDGIISLGRNTSATLDVLANDSPGSVPFVLSTLAIKRFPVGGTAFIDTNTYAIRYDPDFNYEGPDTILYTIQNDSGLVSNDGLIALTVRSEVNDSVVVPRDSTIVLNVLANDEVINDFVPFPPTLAILVPPVNGAVLSIDTVAGTITYQPDVSFTGVDSLIYRVDDEFGFIVAIATVTIHVRSQPVASDDFAVAGKNTETLIPLLENDSVDDGVLLPESVVFETFPANGEAVVDTVTGLLHYFPNFDYIGPDSLQYSVADNYGVRSNSAMIRILVVSAEPPVAVADSIISLGQNTPVTIAVLENDSSESLALVPASLKIVQEPTLGTATVDTIAGTIRYVPQSGALGADSLFYTVEHDSGVVSNEGAVRLTIRSTVNDNALTFADSSVIIDVVQNDSVDAAYPPDPSTLTVVEQPANGVVSFIDPLSGSITYTPNPAYAGPDSLIYRVEDGRGVAVAVATIFITVRPPNQNPVAVDDQVVLRQNTNVVTDVLANDSDPDNDALFLLEVSDPPNGTAFVTDNQLSYTPDINYIGSDSVQYVVHDGFGGRDTATVRYDVVLLAYDITDLGTLGGTVSRAYGLNGQNHVVGASTTASGQIRAFRWRNDTLTVLAGADSGSTQAMAINDDGLIAGVRQQGTTFEPVVWSNDSLASIPGFQGTVGAAYAVNSSGAVVGSASDGAFVRAFSWSGGTMQMFETDPRTSEAFAINASNDAAGYVEASSGQPRAARGTSTSGWTSIDTGAVTSKAFAISDSGYTAGSVQDENGVAPSVWDPAGQRTVVQGLAGNFGEIYGLTNDQIAVGATGTVAFPAGSLNQPAHVQWLSWFRQPALMKTALEELRATIWIQGAAFDLNDAIPATGEWTLLEARAINDSLAIVGTGMYNGAIRAFLLTPSTNQNPSVVPLTVRTTEGAAVAFNALDGAIDPDGERLTLMAVTGYKHGTVAFEPQGQVTYTPFTGFVGKDTLLFTVADRSARIQGSAVIAVSNRPQSFALHQNYPNPFNPATVISFDIPARQKIRLEVYDLLGRRVATLIDDVLEAGVHTAEFRPGRLSSGVYFYTLSGDGIRITRRLVFLK